MYIPINKNIDEIIDDLPLVQRLYFLNRLRDDIKKKVHSSINFECVYKDGTVLLVVKNALIYKRLNNYIEQIEKVFNSKNLPMGKIVIIP